MAKILNFGSLNIDNVYSVDHMLQPGETEPSFKREIFPGGKGLNQSVAASKAGAEVYHAGAVGLQDGQMLLDVLKDAGVNADFVRHHDVATGHTVIMVDKKGQNSILLYGGANQSIKRDEVDDTLNHFGKGDILILQNEINELEYIMRAGYKKGMRIVFNVSPFNEKLLELPLELCSYLFVNEVEGAGIGGISSDSPADVLIESISKKLPATNIVLTLGTRGSVFKAPNADAVYFGCYKVNAVDTTGSGDTYTGYLVHALADGEDIKVAMKQASCAAAISVTRKGAATSIPKMSEVLSSALYKTEP